MALWRETLLAKKVLEGNTRGYRNHPQLKRFRETEDPLAIINAYLSFVLQEAKIRGYSFSQEKIDWARCSGCSLLIPVGLGQVQYERAHLSAKLKIRDPLRLECLASGIVPEVHPVFHLIEGPVEDWEIRK